MFDRQFKALKNEFDAVLSRHHGQHAKCRVCDSYRHHVARLRDEGHSAMEAHRIARGAVGWEIVQGIAEEVN
jgi:hypothetical protein